MKKNLRESFDGSRGKRNMRTVGNREDKDIGEKIQNRKMRVSKDIVFDMYLVNK